MQARLLLTLLFLMFASSSYGKDFGNHGASFQITEEGFIAMIKRRLQNIDINHHQEKMREIAKKSVEEPKPLSRIRRSGKTISHSYDPSYTLDKDIILPCGKLLYKAGTTINPLDHMSWNGRLIFIDARDNEQIEWVEKQLQDAKNGDKEEHIKIVLTGGKPFELESRLNRKIYFDQSGELTSKFNIQNVPAIAEQNGKMLKITEIDIDSSS